MKEFYQRSGMWFSTLTLISFLKVVMFGVVIGSLFSQSVLDLIVKESILAFFSIILLGNVMLEIMFDKRLAQQLMVDSHAVGIITWLGFIQLLLALPLFVFITLHGDTMMTHSFVYQLIFSIFAAAYAIHWKAMYFKTRQEIYLPIPGS